MLLHTKHNLAVHVAVIVPPRCRATTGSTHPCTCTHCSSTSHDAPHRARTPRMYRTGQAADSSMGATAQQPHSGKTFSNGWLCQRCSNSFNNCVCISFASARPAFSIASSSIPAPRLLHWARRNLLHPFISCGITTMMSSIPRGTEMSMVWSISPLRTAFHKRHHIDSVCHSLKNGSIQTKAWSLTR